jgi:hypothetical protein
MQARFDTTRVCVFSTPPLPRSTSSSTGMPATSDHEELAAALDALSPSRIAAYEDWSRVCFALKNAGVSDNEGHRLFHEVSKKARYDAVEVDKLWRRTGDKNSQGQRLTIASIYKWANEDAPGWRDPLRPQPTFNDDGYAVCCGAPVIESKYDGGWCPHCKASYKALAASQIAPAKARSRSNGHHLTPVPPVAAEDGQDDIPDVPRMDDIGMSRWLGNKLRGTWHWLEKRHIWLCWSGTHWQSVSPTALQAVVKREIETLPTLIHAVPENEKRAFLSFCGRYLSPAKRDALINDVKSEDGIAISPDALD